MKKSLSFIFIFLLLAINAASAKPINAKDARKVAENFFKQNATAKTLTFNLFFTENSANGLPAYYVFNVNANDGFIIVSADDAAHPIIGYSTKGQFVKPAKNSP